jgi:hypothetical protein
VYGCAAIRNYVIGVDVIGVDVIGVDVIGVDVIGVDVIGVDALRERISVSIVGMDRFAQNSR